MKTGRLWLGERTEGIFFRQGSMRDDPLPELEVAPDITVKQRKNRGQQEHPAQQRDRGDRRQRQVPTPTGRGRAAVMIDPLRSGAHDTILPWVAVMANNAPAQWAL